MPQHKTKEEPVEALVLTGGMGPTDLIELAIRGGTVGAEAIEKLVHLQEHVEATNARKAFFRALKALKEELLGVVIAKNAMGGGAKSFQWEYLSLDELQRIIDPISLHHGFTYAWDSETDMEKQAVKVTTTLRHEEGHEISNSWASSIDINQRLSKAQQTGVATSYAQRYGLKLILGLRVGDKADKDGRAGADAEPISDDEIAEIVNYLAEYGGQDKFIELARVEELEQIPKREWPRLKKAMDTRAKKIDAIRKEKGEAAP